MFCEEMLSEMRFESVYWPDSQLIRIQIQYDYAGLLIYNDTLQKHLMINCSGFAGITNLCIWDDMIIMNAKIYPADNTHTGFMRNMYMAYDKNADYGGRSLSNGMQELRIELENHITFSVFCQNIQVIEKEM